MKLLTAIVRTDSLEGIVKSLLEKGIAGMTLTEVKGVGEQMQLLNLYTIHSKIELFIDDDAATEAANVILEYANTGEMGDGLIAVLPVERMMKIRTKKSV